MGKVITRAWELGDDFHETSGTLDSSGIVASLQDLGEKLDKESYRIGKHGYEDFSQDIGGIYNRHIHG